MFVIATIADTIRVPPSLLSQPTLTSVQTEIEKRYPNKIIVDVGLVIAPYGPPLQIGDGIFVPGDGGAHHQVVFKAIVFRPFVEEVLIGTVTDSNEDGITVSIGGFFDHVCIPVYWMLNPSTYDETTGLWVWTPTYDDDEKEDEIQEEQDVGGQKQNGSTISVKEEPGAEMVTEEVQAGAEEEDAGDSEESRFEIEIGSEIRVKVKSVNFTRITTTMKGVQATTTTTAHTSNRAFGLDGSGSNGAKTKAGGNSDGEGGTAVRRRSSSADLSDSDSRPAPMQIVGSICEDGLGLTSWWKEAEEEDMEE
ncbi:DNA-directed RNA polymerase III subunit RPC8 [Skeletonema marinoi]|uniref:DNA-directed RNA polymerase III subunit RPC8 n=1 Tax=Skeletonema marinoi TaxID=267567 RepID=A0AAD8XYP0_9STRA|nr:DNA-directed RNA polymerase III subunit RPC8 [Skeletonema marinoi]|mmetsp:Transcript_32111/g.64961  ORF Transcript_32111/g.64961 Transcript_32111/m.64961 type:complete len:307 (-) Transcript_32111:49-969(-)|eukprot:CAMPEP_0113405032 /NCGR_PEP_ID=MMETSP0013_2-20120614/18724_1 /TAXON_ID=2843 ORGANISM="Skeletonema costatum, Strain 1716" /NCGR_SAMPLE_ID=MMETSP0013_2 /ASSEMBLY_ACC=CAM_ASM_000158 /LENGTH=306 /DNA_ID=CAMNT_0000290709 /DNA_START=221 /DNA_END=1141 /DNA_ORIENTATION=- /assembly_acc=CAM_ASM_000158